VDTLLLFLGYVLLAIKVLPLLIGPPALLYLTFSRSIKSSVFARVCNAILAVALIAFYIYLYFNFG